MVSDQPRRGERRTCPSAPAAEGALLLGVVGESGRIALLANAPAVTRDFLDRARQGRPPEQRFRFASPCVERACDKWTGGACGVAATLAALDPMAVGSAADAAASCAIVSTCRWRAEHGPPICNACAFVVTERGYTTSGRE